MSTQVFSFDKPNLVSGNIDLAQAWARTPSTPTKNEIEVLKDTIRHLLTQQNAKIVAHYYVDPLIQDLAEETGGCVADSLEMARFGRDADCERLIVAGVRFMGETAKILSPQKRVFMPDIDATCSLDLGCPIDDFNAFCDQYPDRTVVVYANTSAAVKARADWVVTSSIALDIISYLQANGEKILWAPDRHLGAYIQAQTGADMVLWQGSCLVHDEFKDTELRFLRKSQPDALVLAHPESPMGVLEQADFVGSTAQMLKAVKELDNQHFIVATDQRLFHKMQKLAPHKTWIAAPTGGTSASCKSCAFCPWMSMNSLEGIVQALTHSSGEIMIDERIRLKAKRSVDRMLNFTTSTV